MLGFVAGSVNELSRSYADGSDTGDCSIGYPNMVFLCYYGSAQKHKGMCGDLWKGRDVVFGFYSYIYLYR